MTTIHIPRRSGAGPRAVLAPVVRRRDSLGRPAGKVRMRPAPNPFMVELAARKAAEAAQGAGR